MSLVRCFAVVLIVGASLAWAQSPDAARKEIEASYAKVLDALKHAKSMDDLDEINRSFDTLEWRSITPDNPTQGWPDLRKYGFENLWAPFQSAEMIIDTFELSGDIVVFTGRLRNVNMKGEVAYIPLKETWKRQIHQKFRAGETPK
jgi:hypothetical protein